jgi:hypothetical protein
MAQYCCSGEDGTLVEMNYLGGDVYQCARCTSLRIIQKGIARRITHDEAEEALKTGSLGAIILGGLALLAIAAALSR